MIKTPSDFQCVLNRIYLCALFRIQPRMMIKAKLVEECSNKSKELNDVRKIVLAAAQVAIIIDLLNYQWF